VATIEEPVAIDLEKLEAFVFRAVDEVGATLNTALVVMGDRLGLYRALAGAGPLTPTELAERTGTAERYVREWLNAQAAGGYVEYDPATGRYTLPPEQALALTDSDSPAYLPGFFQIALGSVVDSPRITDAAQSGEGVGWHQHNHDVFEGCERFFRPGYNANLLSAWLPALNPVGRAYYGFSTLLCTPASLSQEVGLALGAQAGEARIRDVVTSGGFTRFRRAAETPFNLVFEARR